MIRIATVLMAFILGLLAGPVRLHPQETGPGWIGLPLQYRLANGLTVVLYKDASFPVVSVVVAYRAGTVVEKSGQSGIALLLQNLMFQGSENIGPKQHISFVQKAGGELNARTTFDRTIFYQTLPSNQLALALWLESDRMKSLALTRGEFERIRSDILAAHRERLESEPYFESFDYFDEILYQNENYAYGHPLIGTGEDLAGLTLEDALSFRAKYYTPTNAILCVVGNIEVSRTRELVTRYFGPLPPGEAIPPPEDPHFEQMDEIRQSWTEKTAKLPGFHLGLRFYPLQTDDTYSLRILEYLLLRGETSRLYSRLLRKERVAYDLIGSLEKRHRVMTLKIFIIGSTTSLVERSRRVILTEFEKLKMTPISEEELEKAKNLFKMDYFMTLSTTLGRALYLVDGVFSGIPPEAVPSELGRYLRTSSPTIRSLAQRHLRDGNRVVLSVVAK